MVHLIESDHICLSARTVYPKLLTPPVFTLLALAFRDHPPTPRSSMRSLILALTLLAAPFAQAADPLPLSADELKAKVIEVTDAQNKAMMHGSTVADVDKLFSLYADDFTYIHVAYGGTYTKTELYDNTVRLLKRGIYSKTEPRYTLVSTIPGYNGIAVERQESHKGVTKKHLAVFEFHDAKVAKIIEYWK